VFNHLMEPIPILKRPVAAAAAAACVVLLWLPSAASAQELERIGPGKVALADEVVVQYDDAQAPATVHLAPDEDVSSTLRALRDDPDVRWADPNPIATASVIPDDPGRSGERAGWRADQWNFLAPPAEGKPCTLNAPCGVGAPRAWRLLRESGHPWGRGANGKRGPIVAVVDTGIAYRSLGDRFARDPDLAPGAFVKGKSFNGHGDLPLDRNGHGTHVASTIAEKTDNGRFVTGLGQGLRLMPVRVLDSRGDGSASDVARGIRWATKHGARVINLSLEFPAGFDGCRDLRTVCEALEHAHRKGVFVVGAAGNAGLDHAQMPARKAFAVASSTIRGCISAFSSRGADVAITAPGGGPDAAGTGSQCAPHQHGPGITQLTLRHGQHERFTEFGYPFFEGTSMAAPHVSAAAALVLSSGVLRKRLGHTPSPRQLGSWLTCTARPPFDESAASFYGAGLLDLAAALDRRSCPELQG
jgi:serine protease